MPSWGASTPRKIVQFDHGSGQSSLDGVRSRWVSSKSGDRRVGSSHKSVRWWPRWPRSGERAACLRSSQTRSGRSDSGSWPRSRANSARAAAGPQSGSRRTQSTRGRPAAKRVFSTSQAGSRGVGPRRLPQHGPDHLLGVLECCVEGRPSAVVPLDPDGLALAARRLIDQPAAAPQPAPQGPGPRLKCQSRPRPARPLQRADDQPMLHSDRDRLDEVELDPPLVHVRAQEFPGQQQLDPRPVRLDLAAQQLPTQLVEAGRQFARPYRLFARTEAGGFSGSQQPGPDAVAICLAQPG